MPKPPLPEQLQTILAKPNAAVMGTVRANGAPLTVATWYLWEDGRVLINFDAGRKRLQHLRRDPRVSLTVLDDAGGWHRHVTLHGHVGAFEDDPELEDIDRLSNHFSGQRYSDRTRPRVSAWIDVDSWHAWGM